MKNSYPKLYVGPMSKLCVDSVLEYNSGKKNMLGLLPSRRQVETKELGGGYVNSWSTETFSEYVRSSGSTIIQRDHAGPSQGANLDDGECSLFYDVDCGIRLIHIDPWKKFRDVEEASNTTFNLIKKCLEKNPDTRFEVGTEEAIRPMSPKDLASFLQSLRSKSEDVFSAIDYGVVQSGTSVVEDRNIGSFNPEKSKEMCDIVRSHGLLSKEHNCDYLTPSQIRDRMKCGVDAFNIAPEFGVTQTRILLRLLEDHSINDLKMSFIKKCVGSRKWEKWVLPGEKEDIFLAQICGHYNFTSTEAAECYDALAGKASFEKTVKDALTKRFSEILCVLQE